MKKTNKMLWAMLLSFVLILTGCNFSSDSGGKKESTDGEESSEDKKVLRLVYSSDIPTLDSTKAHDAIAFDVLYNTTEGLYRVDKENNPILGMVENHEVSDDETVHTFTLKDSKWSNGEQVTAADFEYAWKRVMEEQGAYNYMFLTAGIKNAEPIMNGEMSADELGVKAISEDVLEVTLESPTPLFVTLMSFPTFLPQNQAFVEEKGEQYALTAENVLSNGPFKLVNWTQEQGWKFEKNEDYWDKDAVNLDEISVVIIKEPSTAANLYETDKVDRVSLSTSLVDQYKDDEDYSQSQLGSTSFLRFNHNHEVLGNSEVRRAISMAIDRDGLTNVILKDGSVPLYGVVAEGYYTSPEGVDYRELNGDINKGTKEEAAAIWEEAKAALGIEELTVSINTADTEASKKVAEYLQAQLEEALPGFKLEIKSVPFAQRLEIEKAVEYDISLSTWGPDYSDPMTYLDMWVDGSSSNRMDYKNPKIDELVEQARTETDLSERYKILLEIEKVLLEEDAAVAPLYQTGASILQNPKVVDLIRHPAGPDYSYKWADIK